MLSSETSNSDSDIARSVRWKSYCNIVLPSFLISIIAYLDRNNLSYAKLTMNDDLGFNESQFGFGAGIFFAGYLLFEIPGALIAERFSAKLWIARIMITWGLMTGLLAFVTQPWQFYCVRFLIGAAEASLYPVLFATLFPRWFDSKDRARALAVMLGSLPFSAVIGAPLAGWLVDVTLLGYQGWQVLFLIEAIPAILLGLFISFWLADRPSSAWWLTNEEKRFLVDRQEKELTSNTHANNYSVIKALRDPEVLKLCLIYFLWLTGYWGFNYYAPSILKEQGWSNQNTGWLIAFVMTLATLAMFAVGHSSSITGEKKWHGAIGMFLASIGMILGPIIPNSNLSFLFLCFAGIGVFSSMGVWWSYPTTFLRGAAAAGAVGLINSVGNIGGFVGPYLTGFLKDKTGSYVSAWIYMSMSLLAAGIMMLTLRNRRHE